MAKRTSDISPDTSPTALDPIQDISPDTSSPTALDPIQDISPDTSSPTALDPIQDISPDTSSPTALDPIQDISPDTSSPTALDPIQDPANYLRCNYNEDLFNLETPPHTPEESAESWASILEELVDHNQVLEPSTSSWLAEECAPGALLELLPREPPLQPYVRIEIQPNDTSRYRYLAELIKENRATGVIPGQDSTPEQPTYPTIRIYNYSRHASRKPFVVVSCVTDELLCRAHPNQLYDRKGNTRIVGGMAVADIDGDEPEYQLSRVGILRVLKGNNEISKSLEERAQAKVHPLLPSQIIFPLQNGMARKFNMTKLRLAFQVFVPEGEQAHAWRALEPAVSDPLHLVTKSDSDATALPLQIDEVLPIVGSTDGGTRIVIFLKKENVLRALKVKFHEEDERGWVAEAHVEKVKWRIIVLLTPKYEGRPVSCGERVQVYMYVCNSAGARVSDSVPFQYQRHCLPSHTPHVIPPPPADAELDPRAKRLCTDETSNEELNVKLSSADEHTDEHEADELEKDLSEHFGVMKL